MSQPAPAPDRRPRTTGARDGGPPHRMAPPLLRPGEVLAVGAAASVQFAGDRGFLIRVTQIDKRPTYDGWLWLAGYVLDRRGEAVEKREIFVQRDGLRRAATGARPVGN